jgi:hypothetical protein
MKMKSKNFTVFVTLIFFFALFAGTSLAAESKKLTFRKAAFARRHDDGKLTMIKDPSYRRGEKVNLILFDVKTFEKGKDGKHQFDLDMVVENPSGKVILFKKNLLGEKGHVLLKNGIARSPMGIFESHVGLMSGEYLITVTIYDKIGGAKTIVTQKFTLTDELGYQGVIFARTEADGKFSSVPDSVFKRGDTVNMVLLKVGPFRKGRDGKHGFDIDLMVTNPKGVVVFNKKKLLRRKGIMLLKNNIAETPYGIFYSSSSQLAGQYRMKMTVYDIFSGKKLVVSRPFTLK